MGKRGHKGIIFLNSLLLIGLFLGFGFYLVSLGSNSSSSFSIRVYEEKLLELKTDNQELQLKLSELTSVSRLLELALAKGMVPRDTVAYLRIQNLALR
tara:strand:+ start:1173 stop:1466 length:294 start_codon:yes stop_codon:yes gene_type:complete